jgi:membrane-associated phospholipid phosphatase
VAPKPSRLLYAGFSAAAAALLLFGYLANEVLRGETLRFDNSVRNIVHSWASPTLTYVMRGVTQLGAPRFLIVLSLVLVLWLVNMGRKRAAILLVVAAAGAVALDELLKLVFHRPRPEAYFGYPLPSSYSFPSGHAVSSCCFYGVLAAIVTARMRSRAAKIAVWTAAALMAALIGLSRIYLGVHYPSDVVAGYAVAVVWVAALRASYDAWLRRSSRTVSR